MKIRIGTRKSRLALIQTDLVRQSIEAAFPEAEIEIVEMSTKGDELLDRSLTSFGGKGVFTRELEEALLREEIDLAVHSAKDMPMEFPEGLGIGARAFPGGRKGCAGHKRRDGRRRACAGQRCGNQLPAPGAADQGAESSGAGKASAGECADAAAKAEGRPV